VLEARHQELPDADRGAFDRRAADQERLRAGAAEQSGRLEIENSSAAADALSPTATPAPSASAHRHLGDRRDDLADRRAAVQHVGAIFAIDDDHRAVGVFDEAPPSSSAARV
jgi:hypothetical protein